jgi:hypothetical protein
VVYNFFKPLLNFLIPTLSKAVSSNTGKKLIKQAKKSALKAGVNTLTDITSGENVGKSMSKNLKKATSDILNKIVGNNTIKKQSQKIKERNFIIFFIKTSYSFVVEVINKITIYY